METIDLLRQRITVTEDLLGVVKIMKTLAAVNIRQYLRAVESLADYHRTVEMGLQIFMRQEEEALPATPIRPRRLGIIIFGSEWGMCGQFNEQIVAFSLEKIHEMVTRPEECVYLVVGHRALNRLEEEGVVIQEVVSIPGIVSGIAAQVQGIVLKLEEWQNQLGLDRIVLFHHRLVSKAQYLPQMVFLLPLDLKWLAELRRRPWPSHVLPTYTMERGSLFSALLSQLFFVLLFQAFAESLASENASRLTAMQIAEDNISNRLQELRLTFNQARQTSITEELLDIVAGYEAFNHKT
jgi:F-type H+-transporting ATPase subunit gamma